MYVVKQCFRYGRPNDWRHWKEGSFSNTSLNLWGSGICTLPTGTKFCLCTLIPLVTSNRQKPQPSLISGQSFSVIPMYLPAFLIWESTSLNVLPHSQNASPSDSKLLAERKGRSVNMRTFGRNCRLGAPELRFSQLSRTAAIWGSGGGPGLPFLSGLEGEGSGGEENWERELQGERRGSLCSSSLDEH